MNEVDLLDRKNDHLAIVLDPARARSLGRTGFEQWRFVHCALPELDLAAIDLSTRFLGKPLSAPVLISSMTGGASRAREINHHLADAAQALGLAMAVGSQRVALETSADHGLTRALRQRAPDILLLANLGGAQLRTPAGLDLARRAVDMIDADGLFIHLNPLQEAVQPGGDSDWRGVADAIAEAVRQLQVPVVIKEVGSGLSAEVAVRLAAAGVAALDVAGLGGTHWAAVEAERATNAAEREVAAAFSEWGIPTAQALREVRQRLPQMPLIASGGIRNGIDMAKAIALGADMVGQAAAVLRSATESPEAVIAHFEVALRQLRIACFCTGSANLAQLRHATLVQEAPAQ
ncbi:type 2 isopentenyl-diphosphate Delta-isomerase [Pseudomonas sp. RIT-PI-S]|uniref:type 2 isopentenyl-diphosphate Delta-isomerase n=1 Tax=Pseudomonas sp. RIT-PI-S TaxID=3035295 RepID=UPI0021D9E41B|nr:type 2 isopentenyl-diphosphate Delta-isomerase [Pseudomonas sp. RIT-PI-S]